MHTRLRPLLPLLLAASIQGCAATPGSVSLFGEELYPVEQAPETQARLVDALSQAKAAYDEDPSETNTIWYGRRLDDMTRFQEAVDVYTKGIERFPESYQLYRWRGLRHISLRQFDLAILDSRRAYELMPKGERHVEYDAPEGTLTRVPIGNTQFYILYHYALAHYLREAYAEAEHIYYECIKYADDPVAITNWLYLALRRQNKVEEAQELLDAFVVDADDEAADSPYFKMILLYKGVVGADDMLPPVGREEAISEGSGLWDNPRVTLATQGYGVANWYFLNGEPEKGKDVYRRVLETGYWSAGGFIATEADIFNLYTLVQ